MVMVSHGEDPLAEIRAIQPEQKTIDQRLDDLERRGVLVGSDQARRPLAPVANRPGALKRFLDERNERSPRQPRRRVVLPPGGGAVRRPGSAVSGPGS